MTPSASSKFLPILKTLLYILAWLVLVLGLIAGISLMVSSSRIVENAVMPLSFLGNEILPNLIGPLLKSFLINLGIAILVVTITFSGLLYAIGRLLSHILLLEVRLARLEARALPQPAVPGT